MEEPCIEGVAATYGGLESCVGDRRRRSEALRALRAGWATEPRIRPFEVPAPCL
jgi:hypothetical protein